MKHHRFAVRSDRRLIIGVASALVLGGACAEAASSARADPPPPVTSAATGAASAQPLNYSQCSAPPAAGNTCAWENANYNKSKSGNNVVVNTTNYGWYNFAQSCGGGTWDNCASSVYDNQSINGYFYQNDNCAAGGGMAPVGVGPGGSVPNLTNTDEGNYNDQISSNSAGGTSSCSGIGA